MKEAIIDYKENNNLLPEEITTIKKAIHNLKLTVIVEEVADEIRVESVEETVVEEADVDEPKDDESNVEEISELSISETNEETSNVSTSSEDLLR